MGSHAYGVADTHVAGHIPDFDLYGFAIPPKTIVFPHLTGKIPGFGTKPDLFNQFQTKKTVKDPKDGKEYDFQIQSIVNFFEFCRQNNPNWIDSLWTRENHIWHITPIGRLVRDNRKLFLSKNVWHRFRGYAYSQMKKLKSKQPEGDRIKIVEQYGYDVKFAYNLVRLLEEVEQLLLTGDMDLQKCREVLKAIRRGDWTEERVFEYFEQREPELQKAYDQSVLPYKPDEEKLRQLLAKCLEMHYGSLDGAVEDPDWSTNALSEIDRILQVHRSRLYATGSPQSDS
jgi:hypothetical protein